MIGTVAELARWLGLGLIAWLLPGTGYARLLERWLPMRPCLKVAVTWWAVPVLVVAIGVLSGGFGLSPMVVVGIVVAPGVVLSLRRAVWREFFGDSPGRVVFLALLPALIFALNWMVPVQESLSSDLFAHVAAVRATIEEASVFPVEGFHGDEISRGADVRFGVLHAIYGVASVLGGDDPLHVWAHMRGSALWLILIGAAALLESLRASRIAMATGLCAVLFVYGGNYYNLLVVAQYPLWCSLGLLWTLLALLFSDDLAGVKFTGTVVGLGLGAALGIHIFAFILGATLVLCAAAVAPSPRRKAFVRASGISALLVLPFLVARVIISYANANPIHTRIWECFQWAEGLYSADPVFVWKWMGVLGLVSIAWAAGSFRRARGDWGFRWCVACSLVVLAWLGIPFLLSPSMKLLGFLPLRMVMAVPIPFLLAVLLDRGLPPGGNRPRLVGGVLLLLMVPLAAGRVRQVFANPAEGDLVESPAWAGMTQALVGSAGDQARLLSDPFTMMAVRAMTPVFVAAVPDGRSSPRDPIAIERLRDSWTAMSPATGIAETLEILDRYSISHVLVDEVVPGGMASYEYPVHAASFAGQRQKFWSNPGSFRPLWQGGGLTLFQVVRDREGSIDEGWLRPCLIRGQDCEEGLNLGSGYELCSGTTELVTGPSGRVRLRIDGEIHWVGEGMAPDRQLIVRLDRVPGPVPAALRFAEKPVRKLYEALGKGVWRYRWTTWPGGGRCPIWTAGAGESLPLDLVLDLPGSASAGRYKVHLSVSDLSIFTPTRLSDFLKDDDAFQGPVVGTVELGGSGSGSDGGGA